MIGTPPRSALSQALADAGMVPEGPSAAGITDEVYAPGSGDVLGRRAERRLFPDADHRTEAAARRRIEQAALRAATLEAVRSAVDRSGSSRAEPGDGTAVVEALRTAYRPPWEQALQRWLDAVAPGPRTYARPPRRGADRSDVVLPGRRREGWTLHVVLDTSGSMVEEIPRMLGTLARFAEGANVAELHLLQCDAIVTQNEYVAIDALDRFKVAGFGGSDMTPALDRLAQDPEVEAAVVLTDGAINYPAVAPPFEVLWVLVSAAYAEWFEPTYGSVLHLPAD